jgi:hypothetical protein
VIPLDNVQFKDITGRGLTAIVSKHPWERPSDLPPVGSLIRLNGLVYEVRGCEYAINNFGELSKMGVGIQVRIRGGENGSQGSEDDRSP